MDTNSRLDDFLDKYKFPAVAGLVGLVLIIGGITSSGILSKTFNSRPQSTQTQTASLVSSGLVKVDVAGEVVSPGVYSLPTNARVEDALKQAGGVTSSADPVYVTKNLNLAQKVADGMKIYIPKISEAGPSAVVAGAKLDLAGAQVQASSGQPININTASASELDKLSGVGPVSAQNIIDKRPYEKIEDLLTKKAVSRSVYEKIKGMISTY